MYTKIDEETLTLISDKFSKIKNEISRVIVNYEDIIELLTVALFSDGHVILVGAPGLAKTLLVTSLSRLLGLSFKRIQFTPDLMPADITGVEVFSRNGEFTYVKGPIFANVILADEINRAPPKTQSALLEAMQERQVSIGNTTYPLPSPFFVLATQNPIEYEGTYPLPEAQLDRFMFMLKVNYPSINQEIEIVRRTTTGELPSLTPVLTGEEILQIQKTIRNFDIPDDIIKEVVTLVQKTRPETHLAPPIVKEYVEWGAGPRASQFILLAIKSLSLLRQSFLNFSSLIKEVAVPVLQHRLILNYKAEIDKITPETIINEVLKT